MTRAIDVDTATLHSPDLESLWIHEVVRITEWFRRGRTMSWMSESLMYDVVRVSSCLETLWVDVVDTHVDGGWNYGKRYER
jgi:hypothetical protein